MVVIRVNKNSNYTVMSNYHLKEKKMSLKAKGLLCLMLSLPDNWDYSVAGLVAISKENESSIRSALDELKEFGYLVITKKMPNETNTGRFEYEYNIYEKSQKQEGKKQGVEILGLEFLGVENQGQLNTNKLNTKNKINNNKFKKPKLEEVEQYCRERNNNIDAESFINYYDSIGWLIGKNPMKDWRAAVRTWERNNKRYNNTNNEEVKLKEVEDGAFQL